MRADHAPADADAARSSAEPLAHVLPAAGDRRQAPRRRAGRGRPARSPRRRRGEDRQRLVARLLRARTPGRRRRSRARCAARAVTVAERCEPRRGSASGSRRELVQRQLPAVARVRAGTPAATPSVASSEPPVVLVPAGERRDVREAARGQEAQQLELRVDARLELAERPSGSARRRTRSTSSTARRRSAAPRRRRRARRTPSDARKLNSPSSVSIVVAGRRSGAAARARARGRPARRRPPSRRPRQDHVRRPSRRRRGRTPSGTW